MGGTSLWFSLSFNMSCENNYFHLGTRLKIELDCFFDHMCTYAHMIRQICIFLFVLGTGVFFVHAKIG